MGEAVRNEEGEKEDPDYPGGVIKLQSAASPELVQNAKPQASP